MMRMMMKMAAVSTITRLLLFCSVIASTDSEVVCTHHAATDGNFTAILARPLGSSEKLRWMHGSSLILDRRPNNVFLKGSEKDVHKNGSLKLTNLKKNDAGEYKPEIFTKDGKSITDLKSIHLCILDPVLKPTVKNECLAESKVKFTCAAGQAKDLKFEWLQNGKVLTNKIGPILQENAEKVEKDLFSCKVSNPVSSKTSVAIKQSCFESKSSLFDGFFQINIWIIVGGGAGVVLLLIIIVIFCCIRTRRKKSMQIKDEEELRLGWTNEQQRQHHQHGHPPDQHHHHHHHHQQQPAGHTGPRQHRSKQHREQQRPRATDHPNGQPQPSPRRPAQAPRPVDKVDDEQPPPLPQPRKKAPKTPRA